MQLNYEMLDKVSKAYGDSFYILESEQFTKNYQELIGAFRAYYPETYIAYSYKTNYTPKLCKIVNQLGGYAEIVSDMELEIARRVGVKPEHIIFNGPYKNEQEVFKLLLEGGCVNIDSLPELKRISDLAQANPKKTIHVGVRCNFDIQDGVLSRFGMDTLSDEFEEAVRLINAVPNIHMKELHCHFAVRRLETWPTRVQGMIDLMKKYPSLQPDHVDLGGGIFGKMDDMLKAQFDSYIPTYADYAKNVAKLFAEAVEGWEKKPKLLIEPGSALVGDCMRFAAKVTGIKNIRGKHIATVLGSIYNINPTLNKKNPPLEIIHRNAAESRVYVDLDFGGFTCIESDYLYRHFNGALAVGDYAVFSNVGSYSVVLKPPFILPNFAVVDFGSNVTEVELIKQKEVFDDLFHTFRF